MQFSLNEIYMPIEMVDMQMNMMKDSLDNVLVKIIKTCIVLTHTYYLQTV